MSDSDSCPPAHVVDWVHPRHAVSEVMQALGVAREPAIAAIVRRLATKKITAIYGEYAGPKSLDHHLYPEWSPMPIWSGLWAMDLFNSPESSIWYSGDLEGNLDGSRFFLLNVRLQGIDFRRILSEISGDAYNDNPPSLSAAVEPAPEPETKIRLITPLDPKWPWEKAFAALVALANLDGLEAIEGFAGPKVRGSQASLERWFAAYFSAGHQSGDHPPDSEMRRRAKLVIEALTG